MKYLFSISIGPVQDFIAAARRTRDLWFGSQLLSELSKATAKKAYEMGATLIFPAPTQPDSQLHAGSEFNVANKLLFLLETDTPAEVSQTLETALKARWAEIAYNVLLDAKEAIDIALWKYQVEDVIEFYSAWVVAENYPQARQEVERLLAGRKALRDFQPYLYTRRVGLPKSSLDGLRDSVLVSKPEDMPARVRLKARLKDNEQLDAIGMIKRLGEISERRSYPSVSRLAVDPWVRGILQNPLAKAELQHLADLCKKVRAQHPESISCLNGLQQFQAFPYEGAVLFEQRLADEITGSQGFSEELKENLIKQLDKLYKTARSKPSPYFALLLADGDKMGAAISALDSPEAHRRFSQKLADFAQTQVNEIVEKHQGFLVYSGGDDILAFLPLDTALECARQLHDGFSEMMAQAFAGDEPPTLSVGVVIGHCMEPLEDLLELARKAEKAAKQPNRDGLALLLQTRSGGSPELVRQQWSEYLDQRLQDWIQLHLHEAISDKAAYDIRQVAKFYMAWPEAPGSLIRQDAERLLKRKKPKKGALPPDLIEKLLARGNPEESLSGEQLMQVAQELIISRHLARSWQLSGKDSGLRGEV